MYIESLRLKNVRTFVDETLEFVHPDRTFRSRKKANENGASLLPRPRLPNVNLLLGDNGSGKSTVLRAIAMAALGPSFEDTKLPTSGLVRREPGEEHGRIHQGGALLEAQLLLHDQDHVPEKLRFCSAFSLTQLGELERATFSPERHAEPGRAVVTDAEVHAVWRPVFESNNPSFFAVGYGATRRVETPENLTLAGRSRSPFLRAQRLQGLFQESYALIPMRTWFPRLTGQKVEPEEVVQLLNRLLKPTHCTYAGRISEGDTLFEHGGVEVEFRNLSDGYRAFIGWAADMLFHACHAGPPDKKLADLRGIVMVDEIDLHLHPRWQMKVISTIARTFPRMQFILTSHSPLVVGSLEWMNIITLKLDSRSNSTKASRLKESIHGLDADQVLLSEFFGLSTTRAAEKANKLDRLTLKARGGDDDAARRLIAELAKGMEETE